MAFGLGMQELLLIFAIFMLLFGGGKLRDIGKGMGETIKEFRKSAKDLTDAEREIK